MALIALRLTHYRRVALFIKRIPSLSTNSIKLEMISVDPNGLELAHRIPRIPIPMYRKILDNQSLCVINACA